jgi:hypothetical protein
MPNLFSIIRVREWRLISTNATCIGDLLLAN